jgi:Protein of unknown function (DUF1302)
MSKVLFGGRAAWIAGLLLAVGALWPATARATLRFGDDLQLSGDIAAQNLVRMRTVGGFQLVQQRNTARIRVDYSFLKDDQIFGKYNAPDFIESGKLYMLYRGVYDSYFDFAPGGRLYDFTGKAIPSVGQAGQALPDSQSKVPSSARDAVKWENTLREAYVDLNFRELPLSLRIGRQQIVWGETDNFRLLDRVNALDLTWHLQQETEIGHSWDQLRIPYWMIKWLYQLDNVGPFSNSYLEGYWNPGDWYPNKRRFLPYSPWSLPVINPVTFAGLSGELEDSVLFRQGDYSRDPADNSQMGVRYGSMVGGVQFTIAYLYGRYNQDDGANTAFVRADLDPVTAGQAIGAGILPAQYTVPYNHTFGFSANYYDEFTEAVLKAEQVYVMGMPFNSGDVRSPILPAQLFGVVKKDMWQGMLGFDRPTWIRFLNPRATWLILGQFFWHYLLDNERSVGDQVGLVGNLTPTGSSALVQRGTGAPCTGPNFAGCKALDQVRDWELLMTLAATSFYMSGTLVPQITYALDPVNSFNMLVAWSVDYFLTPDVIVNLAQRYYINTTEAPVMETWGLGGVNRGRSETQLRLTWQF